MSLDEKSEKLGQILTAIRDAECEIFPEDFGLSICDWERGHILESP